MAEAPAFPISEELKKFFDFIEEVRRHVAPPSSLVLTACFPPHALPL